MATPPAAALRALRAQALDERALYFEHDPSTPASPRTERALLVRLHHASTRPAASAPPRVASSLSAFLHTPLQPADDADDAPRLAAWLARHWPPAPAPQISLQRFPATGRGLSSSASLAAGEAALAVPLRLLLTPERAVELPGMERALHAAAAALGAPVDADVRLALALLGQPRLEPRGAWGEYLPLLPAEPPNALMWQAAPVGQLAGTPLPAQVGALRRELRQLWTALVPHLCGGPHAPLPPHAFRWRRFLWAYAIVESRGVVLDGLSTARTTALVPVADMCNHTVRAQLAHPRLEGEPPHRALVLRCLSAVPAGAELQLYYGRLPCLHTLQFYGFVEAELLPFEAVRIDLELPDEEDDPPGGEEGAETASDVAARRRRVLSDLGLGLSHFLRDTGGVPSKLLASLRVCMLSDAELREVEARGATPSRDAFPFAPLNTENEASALHALTMILEAQVEAMVGGAAQQIAQEWEEEDAAWAAEDAAAEQAAAGAPLQEAHAQPAPDQIAWPEISPEDQAAQRNAINEAVASMRAFYLRCYTGALVHANSLMGELSALTDQQGLSESAPNGDGSPDEHAHHAEDTESYEDEHAAQKQRMS
ncbi:hypothetical protein AB1Y20_005984 [Prymnesium parvum]|uniref:SET domain-containing protein n=1 Tax=Prymnesium parvum TaxID=97485 RepID=A0AB34J0E8_PRYPA